MDIPAVFIAIVVGVLVLMIGFALLLGCQIGIGLFFHDGLNLLLGLIYDDSITPSCY